MLHEELSNTAKTNIVHDYLQSPQPLVETTVTNDNAQDRRFVGTPIDHNDEFLKCHCCDTILHGFIITRHFP